jgi:hypothetical protein
MMPGLVSITQKTFTSLKDPPSPNPRFFIPSSTLGTALRVCRSSTSVNRLGDVVMKRDQTLILQFFNPDLQSLFV